MAAADYTVKEVVKAVRCHVSDKIFRLIIDDLLKIQGNQSFRETIQKLSKEVP